MRQGRGKIEGVAFEGMIARLSGEPILEVTLRRSGRARRLSLRVSGLDGRATLTIPTWYPQEEALVFLREKEDWLRQALGRLPSRCPIAPGSEVLLEGRRMKLREGRSRQFRIEDEVLFVPPDPTGTRTAPRLEAFLKASARAAVLPAVTEYAAQIGRSAQAVSLRDTRSRWGSCTADGRLMFSWRLIMAPPQVLRYVAAHEVAHLVHMDHSRAFWDCVDRLMPDYGPHRQWLRNNGAQLHGYCFKPRSSGDNG